MSQRRRPMLAALAALAVTGGLYAAAAAAFTAMLWTVFQLVMWVFGG